MIRDNVCISCITTISLLLKNGIPICEKCLLINSEFINKYDDEKVKNYPEINFITDKVFLGNYDAAKSKDLLIKNNITHVLTYGKYMELKFKNDFKYLQLNIEDIIEEDIENYFKIAFDFIESGETVFVHCNAGVSRSPSIVIAYLMRKNKLTFLQAYDKVKTCRDSIFPNESFINQLKIYEEKLKQYN